MIQNGLNGQNPIYNCWKRLTMLLCFKQLHPILCTTSGSKTFPILLEKNEGINYSIGFWMKFLLVDWIVQNKCEDVPQSPMRQEGFTD